MSIQALGASPAMTGSPPITERDISMSGSKQSNPPGNVSASTPVESPKKFDNKVLEQAVKEVQDFVSAANNNLQFSVDEDTGRTVVKIIDRQTDQILRQIPSEEMLQIAKALGKLSGLFVKQQA